MALQFPEDRLYDAANDLWVRRDADVALIGPTSYGAQLAGDILALTPKVPGSQVDLDRGLAVIEVAKTLIALHSPLTLVVVDRNESAMADPSLLNRDPYGDGWIVRVRPQKWAAESARLIDAAAYASHVRALPSGERS